MKLRAEKGEGQSLGLSPAAGGAMLAHNDLRNSMRRVVTEGQEQSSDRQRSERKRSRSPPPRDERVTCERQRHTDRQDRQRHTDRQASPRYERWGDRDGRTVDRPVVSARESFSKYEREGRAADRDRPLEGRGAERREDCRDDRHQQQWKQGNRWLQLYAGDGIGDTRIENVKDDPRVNNPITVGGKGNNTESWDPVSTFVRPEMRSVSNNAAMPCHI